MKALSFIMAVILFLVSFPFRSNSKKAKRFRLTSYVVASGFVDEERIDKTHFSQLTDIIFFGAANFNESGEIELNEDFEIALKNLKNAMSESEANLYLNVIGPGFKTDSDDWTEQMNDQSLYHNKAFESGKLENNIKSVLEKYDFDGIFFDYEYPLTKKSWKVFDKFLISLDSVLGDEYKIGAAISGWSTKQSLKGRAVLDMVEVMAYDVWDKDGTHASIKEMKKAYRQMLWRGYSPEQIDIGIPFYARPTTKEAYWYGYNGYSDITDENGLCYDEETGLTFSFNTDSVVYEKTKWAIKMGLGGAMVWHYSCDIPSGSEKSLFDAMYKAKTDLSE